MLAVDRVEGDVLAHVAVQHEFHPAILKLADAVHHHVLLQLEAGNAVGHQPARAVVTVIDRDLHPGAAQRIGGGKAAGTRADDADAFRPFPRRTDRLDPTIVEGGVGDEFLDRADGDGAVARLFDHAIAFAEAILRADAAANLREGVGGLRKLIGLLQPPLGGHPQPVGDIVVQRAMRLAVRHTALAAPPCLLFGLGQRELTVNLVEILGADIRLALLRHLFRDRDEFQHALLGHGSLISARSSGCALLLPMRQE